MSYSPTNCQYCGARLVTNAHFCEACGKPVQVASGVQAGSAQYTTSQASSRPGWTWVLWFAAGIFGTIVLLSVVIFGLLILDILPSEPIRDLVQGSTDTPTPTGTQTPTPLTPTATVDSTQTAFAALPTLTDTPTITLPPPTETPDLSAVDAVNPTPGSESTATGEVYTFPDDRVFLVDDFSDRYLNWATEEIGDTYVSYHEGQTFAIAIAEPGYLAFSYPQVDYPFILSDVVVSVSGHMVEGTGYWGIRCRYIDEGNFYMVAIADGYYMIAKAVDGQYDILTEPEWVPYEELGLYNYEDGFVPITVSCIGNTIDLEVDGFSVLNTITDDTHLVGYYDIYARSGETPGEWDGYYIKMLFDNFGMYVP